MSGYIIALITKRRQKGKGRTTKHGKEVTHLWFHVIVLGFDVICNSSRNYSTIEALYWIALRVLGGGDAVLLCKVNMRVSS